MHRVVITGIGVASPVGCGRDRFWSALIAGRSGIDVICLFDASTFPVRIAGEVGDLDTCSVRKSFPETAGLRDRKVLLALSAAREALMDAQLDTGERDTLALALIMGKVSVLMDESIGRACARGYGLAVRGSLGILVEAFRQNLLDKDRLRLALNEMSRRPDIWISSTLVERVLRELLEE